MTYFGRAVEDPAVVARITEILERQWDPDAVVRRALQGGDGFYREHAVVVAGMLSADARETKVQRYLRQLEQQAGPATLHPAEARHATWLLPLLDSVGARAVGFAPSCAPGPVPSAT